MQEATETHSRVKLKQSNLYTHETHHTLSTAGAWGNLSNLYFNWKLRTVFSHFRELTKKYLWYWLNNRFCRLCVCLLCVFSHFNTTPRQHTSRTSNWNIISCNAYKYLVAPCTCGSAASNNHIAAFWGCVCVCVFVQLCEWVSVQPTAAGEANPQPPGQHTYAHAHAHKHTHTHTAPLVLHSAGVRTKAMIHKKMGLIFDSHLLLYSTYCLVTVLYCLWHYSSHSLYCL